MKKTNQQYKINTKFSITLVEWYRREHRKLPWRETRNPYHILVSEIMLQQTQVNTVIPYYLRFLETLPQLEDLAQASDEQLHRLWEGLGYYSRVFRLRQFARVVCQQYGGIIPKTKEQLLALPGIGPYTCGAILSFAFHVQEPAIDGNVKRVIARVTCDYRDISKKATLTAMEQTIWDIMPEDPYEFNQGLIELGATYCNPRQPKCVQCPVCSFCKAYAKNEVECLPNKPKKKKQKEMCVPVFILCQDEDILWVKRSADGLLASLWSLPIVEKDFTGEGKPEDIVHHVWVHDYFSDNFGRQLQPESIQYVGEVKHVFSHIIWKMQVFVIEDIRFWEQVDGVESPEIKKIRASQISLPTAFKKCIDYIEKQKENV